MPRSSRSGAQGRATASSSRSSGTHGRAAASSSRSSGTHGRATASSSRSSGTQGRATASSSRSSGTQGSSGRGRRIRISTRNRDERQQTTQQSQSISRRRRQPSTSSSSSSSSSDTTEEYELALSVTVSIPSGGHSTASPRTSRDPPPPSSSGNSHAQPPRDPAPSRPTVEHRYLPRMMNPSPSDILRLHHQRQAARHVGAGNEGGRISFQIETDSSNHHGSLPRDPAPSRSTVEHRYLPGVMNPSLSEILRPHHQRQAARHGDAGNEGGRISFQIETDSISSNHHAQPPRDPAPSRPTVEHRMINPSPSDILRLHHQRQRARHGGAGNGGGRISFQIETDHHGSTEEPQTSRTLPSSSEPIVVDDDSPPRVSPPQRRPVVIDVEEFGSNSRRNIISMFRAQNRYNQAQNNGRDLIFHYDLGAIGVGGQRRRRHSSTNHEAEEPVDRRPKKPRVNMTTAQIKEAILLSPRNGDDNTFLRNNECNICLQSFRDLLLQQHHLVSTTCGHVFCRECATKSIKPSSSGTKCPCCRKKLEVPYYFRLHLPMHPKFKKSNHIKEEEEAEPSRL